MTRGIWTAITASIFFFSLFASSVNANTEKVVFLGPSPAQHIGSLSQPLLPGLSHPSAAEWSTTLRTSLPVAFPTNDHPDGLDSWFALRNLNEGQRYEVRVCWAATQPTTFGLDVFEVSEIIQKPSLQGSLEAYTEQKKLISSNSETGVATQSILYLRVQAAADFFTTNDTLMRTPPLVHVDIVLDPYLASIFPQSLIYTSGYIVILAIGGVFLSGLIWNRLRPSNTDKDHKD